MLMMIWIVFIILITSNYAYIDDISCNNYLRDYCNHEILNYGNYFDVKLTFIIPTIGRDTLIDTITSLLHQTNDQWKAIVIFDGIDPTIANIDKRISIIKSDKLGEHVNSAGNVRNYGIQFATTEWVAFLDDDDSISNDYVDLFYLETETNKSLHIELLLFRMLDDGQVKPNLNLVGGLKLMNFGISFAVKKTIFDQGLVFTPSPMEDFNFISKCVSSGYVLLLSPYITYYVRQYKLDVMASNENLGNRLLFRV